MKKTLEEIINDELPNVKLTKSKLAKLVGLSGGHFTNISNGRASSRKSGYRYDPQVINKLAYYLKVPVEKVLDALGIQLSKVPPELSEFIESYKNVPEEKKIKVLAVVYSVVELVSEDDKEKDKKSINKTVQGVINGQEVNMRILEPTVELEKILTKN